MISLESILLYQGKSLPLNEDIIFSDIKAEVIILFVIAGVLIIDFIIRSRKKPSIDETNNRIENKKTIKSKSFINYLIDRKRNIVSFIIGTHILKVLLHYFLYPYPDISNVGPCDRYKDLGWHIKNIYALDSYFLECYNGLKSFSGYYGELWLFIPSFFVLAVIIWLFNDKIKAR
tara:strand:- start:207 stop:731 length:525 start_codon:yes stop_codon:yes gene_type:complete